MNTFRIEKEFDLPADKVWDVVGEDYGGIASSHPAIVSSSFLNGATLACEGAERLCNFNEEGTQYMKEKMVNYDPLNRSFTNQVFESAKFPIVPEKTRALYKVEDLGNGRSNLIFDMTYETRPAILAPLMKSTFRKLIKDYFVAIEYYASTGDAVTKKNFKDIKKQYA